MIFKIEMVEKILLGRKTQTRRVVKPGEVRCRYVPERVYKVQARRGGTGLIKIEILAAHKASLHDIDHHDAKAEGFKDRDDFLAYWGKLHGNTKNVKVWVIEFCKRDAILLNRSGGWPYYTDDPDLALHGEGEAPTAVELEDQRRRSVQRQAVERKQRRQAQQLLPVEARIAELQVEAARRRIDIRSETRLVRKLQEQGKGLNNVMLGIQRKLDQDLERAA